MPTSQTQPYLRSHQTLSKPCWLPKIAKTVVCLCVRHMSAHHNVLLGAGLHNELTPILVFQRYKLCQAPPITTPHFCRARLGLIAMLSCLRVLSWAYLHLRGQWHAPAAWRQLLYSQSPPLASSPRCLEEWRQLQTAATASQCQETHR